MTVPPLSVPPSTPPSEASADAAALEMADVITAIFRMFDGHIDTVLGSSAPTAYAGEAYAPVALVGAAVSPDGFGPHG